MFGVQNDLPRVPFSRPSPWQLTDTPHSTIPPRVSSANAVRGACMCVCVRVCVCWTGLKLCRVTKLVSGDILQSVCAQLSYTQAHTHTFLKHHPSGPHQGEETLTDTSVCASPGFGFGSLMHFFFLAAYLQDVSGLYFSLSTKPMKRPKSTKRKILLSSLFCAARVFYILFFRTTEALLLSKNQ